MDEELKKSYSFYQEEDTVKGIYINVFFHEDHQKYEIELSKKNGEEGEQPLAIVISNGSEEGKNPELAKFFFTLAIKLAEQGKSIGEIYDELEKNKNDKYRMKAMNILAFSVKEKVETVVDLNSKNLEELEKYIGQKYPDKKLIYDIYLQSIPHYNPIDDKEKRNYILKLLNRDLTLGEKLVIKFQKKYSDVDNIPTNYLLFLNSIIELGETGDISDKERKAEFFIFMYEKNKNYDFSDEKNKDLFYTNFSEVIKEFFKKGYFNTTGNSHIPLLEREQEGEISKNRSEYRPKELTLVERGIGNEDTTHKQFKKLLNEKYQEFVTQTLSLVAIERADIILQKLGKQDIPEHSPIFLTIVQLLQGKKFEDISLGTFENTEGINLELSMKNFGIPTTKEGLEKFLINEEENKEISFYSIPGSAEARHFADNLDQRTQYLR